MDVLALIRQGLHSQQQQQQQQQQHQQQQQQQQLLQDGGGVLSNAGTTSGGSVVINSNNNNPIFQHFRIHKQVSNAGQEMVWKIFDATRIVDDKKSSLFIFEKKVAEKLHKPKRREMVAELLRRDLDNMGKVRHNKVIKMLHPVEECNSSIAFASEPIRASLTNLMGNYDKLPLAVQMDLKEQSFLDVELKTGIYQITEAVRYLHVGMKMLHMNISPQNIIVTRKGVWKLSGFAFAKIVTSSDALGYFQATPWQAKSSKMTQPDLDFIAPEIQSESSTKVTWASDVFSLGMVICWLFNGGKPLLQASYNPTLYGKLVNKIDELYSDLSARVPPLLSETLMKMINKNPSHRPSIQYISMIKYFDDPTVESYQMLDKVLEFNEAAAAAAAMTSSAAVMTSSAAAMTSSTSGMTSSAAMSSSSAATATAMATFWSKDFVENFAHNLSQVPKKLLQDNIFPTVAEQLQQHDKLLPSLPLLLLLVDVTDDVDYKTFVSPQLKTILSCNQPAQVNIYLLEKLDVLLKRCDDTEVRSHIFPLVFNSLASNNILCQEAALNTYPAMESYLDDSIIRRSILPKAKNLFLKATSVRSRLTALQCIDKLLDNIEKMVILDEVLPFLIEIQCSDVDIAMSIVAIYKHLLSDRKFGLTHNLLATKVMPSLVPLTVYPGLSIYQFNSLMTLLHDMLAQIEQERINKMINELPPPQQYNDTQRRLSSELKPMNKFLFAKNNNNNINQPGANINNNINNNNNNAATTNQNASLLNQSFLHVDFNAYRPPSTPEFTIQSASESRDHLDNPGYKRHASFQSLGVAEQAVFEMVRQRRLSQMSGQSDIRANTFSQHNPHIHISQASMTASLKDNVASLFSSSKHRDSIVSIGPIVFPDFSRRESSGKLTNHPPIRRSSFQGICESAMQYFGVK